MYHPPSRRVRFWRKIRALSLMTAAVVAGAAVLTALTLGYGFDQKEGRLEQGGLLQLNTQPTGATVTINGTQYGSRTPTKLSSHAGDYEVTMERKGYHEWKKTLPIQSGNITWATYPRLIPTSLKPETVAEYPATAVGGLPSGSSRRYAVLEDISSPVVAVTRIDGDEVTTERHTLPPEAFTAQQTETSSSRFSLEEWTGDEKHLLVRHTYGEPRAEEWLLFNLSEPEESINITQLLGIGEPMREPIFTEDNGSELYARIGSAVRIIDLDRETLSRPLVQDVATYSVYGDGFVLYAKEAVDGKQEVGYVKEDYDEPRLVRTVENTTDEPAHFDIGKYYDKYYFLISHGTQATLWSSRSVPDNSTSDLKLTHEQTMELDRPIIAAHMTDNGQFATIQDGASFATYNLEINQLSETKLALGADKSAQEIEHLDRYLYWAMRDDTLRTYEFDGSNQHDIMQIDARFGATLSPAGKYVYGVNKLDDGTYGLVRVKLLEIDS